MKLDVRYEVEVSAAKVWTVDRSFPERRDAIAHARTAYANPENDGIRVIRYRTTSTGLVFQTTILHQQKPVAALKGNRFASLEDAPVCTAATELFLLEGRMTIGQVLRSYLETEAVTPTELLHSPAQIQKLQKAGLVEPSMQRIAHIQATKTKTTTRARMASLMDMLKTVESQAKTVEHARRGLKPFTGADLPGYAAALNDQVPTGLEEHALLAALSDHLGECENLGQKLDRVLALMSQPLDSETLLLVEGVLADLLAFPSVLRDLFGNAPRLGDQLADLADLLHGREERSDAPSNPRLAAIGLLVQTGKTPSCAKVLLERILSELEGSRPLDPSEPEAEKALLDEIDRKLRDTDGERLGGRRAERAIAQRQMRIQQRRLREMGLHDVADALPRTWQGA